MKAPLLCTLLFLASCAAPAPELRVASFNVAMNRPTEGALRRELAAGTSEQARKIAAILRRVRPDIVLLCEFDHDAQGAGLEAFRSLYLEATGRPEEEGAPIVYPYVHAGPVNTGIPSGRDLDKNGRIGTAGRDSGGDAFGYGLFPGQYGMALLSRYPIDPAGLRSFQRFLWKDLPGGRLPRRPDGSPWYDLEDRAVLRLSSKSHWDVPILVRGRRIHLLASHPTPPVFDGPEDRNGFRNRDELLFWVKYLDDSRLLVDDRGRRGGLPRGAAYVLVGDLNADPVDGDATGSPLRPLLAHPRMRAHPVPASEGAVEAARIQGGWNANHRGPAANDTCDIPRDERGPGNLRLDYVLPGGPLQPVGSGVFWPLPDEDGAQWIDASDHRLVWVDFHLP